MPSEDTKGFGEGVMCGDHGPEGEKGSSEHSKEALTEGNCGMGGYPRVAAIKIKAVGGFQIAFGG